jgi:hypothetical protein
MDRDILEKIAYQAKANIGGLYASQASTCGEATQEYRPSLRDRVQAQADSASRRAGEATRMQELSDLLHKNPDVARILELMGEFHG